MISVTRTSFRLRDLASKLGRRADHLAPGTPRGYILGVASISTRNSAKASTVGLVSGNAKLRSQSTRACTLTTRILPLLVEIVISNKTLDEYTTDGDSTLTSAGQVFDICGRSHATRYCKQGLDPPIAL